MTALLTCQARDVRDVPGIGGSVARKLVIGDLRVQAVERGGGRGRSFTIVWPDGAVHEAADRFLRGYEGSGTQRTYAYLLLDHLRWLEREALAPAAVSLRDLKRYMAALGAAWRGPYGQPWRAGRRPFGPERPVGRRGVREGFLPAAGAAGCQPGAGLAAAAGPAAVACRPAAGVPRATSSGSCPPTRWPRRGRGGGIRSCRLRAPGSGCWRR